MRDSLRSMLSTLALIAADHRAAEEARRWALLDFSVETLNNLAYAIEKKSVARAGFAPAQALITVVQREAAATAQTWARRADQVGELNKALDGMIGHADKLLVDGPAPTKAAPITIPGSTGAVVVEDGELRLEYKA